MPGICAAVPVPRWTTCTIMSRIAAAVSGLVACRQVCGCRRATPPPPGERTSLTSRGTGTAAQIPGVTVAGKTGTAELSANSKNYDAWFIFFAPAENPVVAGAVLVESQPNGFGGAVAAPIAKQIMQAILPPASNSKSGTNGH